MAKQKNFKIIITKPIPLIFGLGLWSYAVFYHMDVWGALISGIGMLFYGYSIAKGTIENSVEEER